MARTRWGVVAGAAAVGVALLAAGCGGGSGGPRVAQVGTTSTSTSSSRASGATSNGNPARYSACMRKNGVPDFPDPDANGNVRISGGVRNGRHFGVDPDSPQFRKAQQACQKLAPNGGRPNPQQQAKEREAALAFSACMRKNGVPKFPDPTFGPNGGMTMTFGKKVGLDPSSPAFQAAQRKCQNLVPGGPIAGGAPGS